MPVGWPSRGVAAYIKSRWETLNQSYYPLYCPFLGVLPTLLQTVPNQNAAEGGQGMSKSDVLDEKSHCAGPAKPAYVECAVVSAVRVNERPVCQEDLRELASSVTAEIT